MPVRRVGDGSGGRRVSVRGTISRSGRAGRARRRRRRDGRRKSFSFSVSNWFSLVVHLF